MKKNQIGWIIFLVIQIVIIQILGLFPEFVERFYSNGLYPFLGSLSRILFGFFSVSIGDVLYFIAGLFLLKWFVQLFRKSKNWKLILGDIGVTLSLFYFTFHLLWAFNYYRETLFDKMNIQQEYSDADLIQFTKQMIQHTNALHLEITNDPNAKVKSNLTQDSIFEKSTDGYKALAQRYSFFAFENPSMKRSLFSLPLSYMGFSGYLNPFTNEAQVNDRVPMINFPFTVCHEMAHQIGYASESEANFIGFLAVIHNDDLHFKYAGYSAALLYCLGNLQSNNNKLRAQLLDDINPGIIKNYEDSRNHWLQYEGVVEDGSKTFYDTFLKANQQKDGLDSYSKFLNLLINYAKNNKLETYEP